MNCKKIHATLSTVIGYLDRLDDNTAQQEHYNVVYEKLQEIQKLYSKNIREYEHLSNNKFWNEFSPKKDIKTAQEALQTIYIELKELHEKCHGEISFDNCWE